MSDYVKQYNQYMSDKSRLFAAYSGKVPTNELIQIALGYSDSENRSSAEFHLIRAGQRGDAEAQAWVEANVKPETRELHAWQYVECHVPGTWGGANVSAKYRVSNPDDIIITSVQAAKNGPQLPLYRRTDQEWGADFDRYVAGQYVGNFDVVVKHSDILDAICRHAALSGKGE